jgi:uncharacterized membrane protein (DUF373 family)
MSNDMESPPEPLFRLLNWVIRMSVRVLAILMTGVIVLGVVDVGWMLHKLLMEPPVYILTINDILATFGAFMAVLIAIEIFVNIVLYLRDDVIHVKIVMATALMAIARKLIVLDREKVTPAEIAALGFAVLAVSLGYWLVNKSPDNRRGGMPSRSLRDSRKKEPAQDEPVPAPAKTE